jgi:succinate--hydroxymethylglutarate CoA-transferase
VSDAGGRPLDGVRVIEFGEFAAGPFCGLLLADWGADVVKIESPEGDRLRGWPPFLTDADGSTMGANFVALNRNKRSVVLDLKDPVDRARAVDLCVAADVVVENHRPGVMGRRGLDYDALRGRNPRLVYCSVSGYGQTGPYATRGAFDVAIQAVSGLMSVTGEAGGPPAKAGVAIADFLAGSYAATSVLAGLRSADRTGQGCYVDCSMLSCMLSIATIQVSEYFGLGVPPVRLGTRHPQNAPYQAFRGRDEDDYFVVAAGTQAQWESLCELLDLNELVKDSRYLTQSLRVAHQQELEATLAPVFATKSGAEWLVLLDVAGIPCSPVYDYAQVLADPHVQESALLTDVPLAGGGSARALANPVKMTGYDFEVFHPPPVLGAHNDEVRNEWLGGPATERRLKQGAQ